MKICEHCGFKNWNVASKCGGCRRPFKQTNQSSPMVGQKQIDGGNRIPPLKSHND